jgi:hypothetical protein
MSPKMLGAILERVLRAGYAESTWMTFIGRKGVTNPVAVQSHSKGAPGTLHAKSNEWLKALGRRGNS